MVFVAACWPSSSRTPLPPPCRWSRRSKRIRHEHKQHRGDIPWVATVSISALTSSTAATTTATTAATAQEKSRVGGGEADVAGLGLGDDEAWLDTLRDAEFRAGGTLKCLPSARPDGTRGVRVIKQYWRTGDTSSYDGEDGLNDFDVVSEAVRSATASKTSSQNTLHHVSSFLRRSRIPNNNNNNNDDDDDGNGNAAKHDDVENRRPTHPYGSSGRGGGGSCDGATASSSSSTSTNATTTAAAASASSSTMTHTADAASSQTLEDLGNLHPVLRALLERKRTRSKPGARCDNYRIGLAVEGGGMRGVISAGATGEILRMGFADCFDAVYGSSAGAMNLTYYLAKQPEGRRRDKFIIHTHTPHFKP